MKILIATGLYPPDIGGPATYAKMLESELPKAAIELEVFHFGEVRHLPKVIRHFSYAYKLFRKSKEADVIYALDSISVGLPAVLVAKLRRKTLLVRLGGDYAWEQGRIRFGLKGTLDEYTAGATRRPLPVKLLAALQSFVVKRARFVVLPSEYLKSIVLTWGVKEERVQVIYSALFPLPIEESKEVIRERLAYEDIVLLTAARLTPWKGIAGLIELLVALRKENLPATLVVVGDGEEEKKLKELARKLGVAEQVRFVGRLSKEALGAAVKGADVFVYNTSYEGLPHQLLEVMDLGVPVVASDIAGNREVIRDGVEGLLVEQNNLPEFKSAVKRLLDNPKLVSQLTANARVRAKDFEQSKVTAKLIKLLQSL